MVRETLLGLALVSQAVACGFDACGSAAESTAGTAPKVEDLRLASQLDGDPATLVFGARFTDADGNLRDGRAAFHLNGSSNPDVEFALSEVFRQSALPVDARGGELALTLRLVQAVDDDSDLRLGLRLIDEAEQPSNCYPLELEFTVADAALDLERRATELFALMWPSGSNQ